MDSGHLSESWKERLELYALGTLSIEGVRELERHLESGCPVCNETVLEIQGTLVLLPENLPHIPLRPSLKRRILQEIDVLQSTKPAGFAGEMDFDRIPWEDSGIAGVGFYWFQIDNETGTTAGLIRVKPGSVFTDHRHVGAEDCFVLQGGFQDERGTYHAGQYVHYEPGSIQRNLRALAGEDCILFLVNERGIEFLTENS